MGQSVPADSFKQVRRSMVDKVSVQTPFPVPVITHRPTVLPAKMDQFTRVLMTMANMEQDGPF